MSENTTTERTPQAGDLMILDGITRRIVNVERGAVEFDHPSAAAEQVRRTLMAAWKERRAPYKLAREQWEARQKASATLGLPFEEPEPEAFVELPPEASRRGVVGMQWMYWMDGLNCWAVQGRIEARSPKSGATVLEPAIAQAVLNPGS